MIVISLLPPSFEGTVNFSTLDWHGGGDGAGGTELTTGGGSVGGFTECIGRIVVVVISIG